jgi:hypothetical protein
MQKNGYFHSRQQFPFSYFTETTIGHLASLGGKVFCFGLGDQGRGVAMMYDLSAFLASKPCSTSSLHIFLTLRPRLS